MELLSSNVAKRSAHQHPEMRIGESAGCSGPMEPARRHAMIAEAVYFRSLRRAPGDASDFEDWLVAEREVDAKLQVSARLK